MSLDAGGFCEVLASRGCSLFTGVPCSSLQGLIAAASAQGRYLIASSEGDAAALCAGLHLGGVQAALLMQNSGLANACSPLSSLTHTFRIPLLSFISLRGEPGRQDEPQHELLGRETTRLLELLGIGWEYLSTQAQAAAEQVRSAQERLSSGLSFAFVVKDGTFAKGGAAALREPRAWRPGELARASGPKQLPRRMEALGSIVENAGQDAALLAATGKTGRELCELADSERNFYMLGSMGCLGSLALGVALARPSAKVVAIDGDGALLMRLGALAMIAQSRPANLLHVVLDNGSYDSTGGQPTLSPGVDIAGAAAALGYPRAFSCDGLDEFGGRLRDWSREGGLTLLHLRIAPGSKEPLGRPRRAPEELRARFMGFLGAATE